MAEQKRRKAKEFHLGTFHRNPGTRQYSKAPDNGSQTSESVCLRVTSCAEASTTEEPDAGILHVRDCAGGAG